MELRMKESHIEGLANHNGPESSTLIRKDAREAVTGESTGRVLSREKGISRVPTLSTYAEGNTDMREKERRRVHIWPCAVEDPLHVWKLHAREPGEPASFFRGWCGGTRREERSS